MDRTLSRSALHTAHGLPHPCNGMIKRLWAHVGDGIVHLQIFVRIRPFSTKEVNAGLHPAMMVRSERQLSMLPHSEATQYTFDKVMSSTTDQATVFEGALLQLHAHVPLAQVMLAC